MPLSKEQYAAFEDILGAENITDNKVVRQSYSWRSGMLAGVANSATFTPLFEAILLPENTAQVQAIVKLCNKFNIQFKASSTGWGAFNDASGPGCIRIDLRRMNKIIEINEKNMYAVVEPYVISAQLQAELMKRGFTMNMCGAGSNCTALPIAAHQGVGHMSQSASYGERNQLGLEWVTPDGELVRLGSVGAQDEWFCADGPGPSLRGIVRGNVAPLGGIGVFTKAALKIYHWPGPATMELQGISPSYAPAKNPENYFITFFAFPSMDELEIAQEKMGESELAYELVGFNAGMAASNIATSNEEDVRLFAEFKKYIKGPSLMALLVGDSDRDFAFKKKAMYKIVEEAGGKEVTQILEDPKRFGGCLWRYLRSTGSIREVFRVSGVFGGEVGGTDTFRLMSNYITKSGAAKQDLIDRGLIYDDGFTPFTQSFEHGHYGHGELLIRYMPVKETCEKLGGEFFLQANQVAIDDHFGVPGHVFGDMLHDMYGPHVSNYHLWLRKIKKAFDPKGLSEGSHYITNKK
jgi:glycolate oxidase